MLIKPGPSTGNLLRITWTRTTIKSDNIYTITGLNKQVNIECYLMCHDITYISFFIPIFILTRGTSKCEEKQAGNVPIGKALY